MDRFRFMPVEGTGDYDREYVAIYRGGPTSVYKIRWRQDGSLKLPRSAKGIGDALYVAFIEWLEERYPREAMLALIRYGLQVPLETPQRWH